MKRREIVQIKLKGGSGGAVWGKRNRAFQISADLRDSKTCKKVEYTK
jgi:hypothetical protein